MSLGQVPVDGTIWTQEFWKATAERAIRTAAISASLVLVGDVYQIVQLNAFNIDWLQMIGFAIGGALLSTLWSIGTNARRGTGPDVYTVPESAPRRALPDETREGESP